MTLLPVVPILLFPFIIVFFVVVFPLWVVALGVLGLILALTRLVEAGLRLARLSAGDRVSSRVHAAFRWVLTFGGLAESPPDDPPAP